VLLPVLGHYNYLRILLMMQVYPRTEKEKLNLIARAAYERTRSRHQETLRRLRLLASII